MCSIEEAAATTFDKHDPDGGGLIPVKELRQLIDETYKMLDRKVEEKDVEQIKRHQDKDNERSINKDEFIRMVKETIAEQGKINNQSDV